MDEGQRGETYGLSTTKTSSSLRNPRARPLLTNSFFRVSPRPSASPVYAKLVRREFACGEGEGEGLTAAETKDLDVVPQFGFCEGENGGREEHGLVIGVGD